MRILNSSSFSGWFDNYREGAELSPPVPWEAECVCKRRGSGNGWLQARGRSGVSAGGVGLCCWECSPGTETENRGWWCFLGSVPGVSPCDFGEELASLVLYDPVALVGQEGSSCCPGTSHCRTPPTPFIIIFFFISNPAPVWNLKGSLQWELEQAIGFEIFRDESHCINITRKEHKGAWNYIV